MVIQFLKKNSLLFMALVSTLAFFIYFWSAKTNNLNWASNHLQKDFLKKEAALKSSLDYHSDFVGNNNALAEWNKLNESNSIGIHIYENDSLIFWNTNQLPILRYAEIHFPSDGLLHLQNGWYYAKIKEVDDYTVCASFLLKQDYAYENRDLVNSFAPDFHLKYKGDISLVEEKGYPIKDSGGNFVFSVEYDELQQLSHIQTVIITVLLILFVSTWLVFLIRLIKRKSWYIQLFAIVSLLGIRLLFLFYGWSDYLGLEEVSDPALFGTNALFPNFLELLLNIITVVFALVGVLNLLSIIRNKSIRKVLIVVLLITSPVIWVFIIYLMKVLILNSSIPLLIDKLFTLNAYSILAVLSIGTLFFTYYRYVRQLLELSRKVNIRATSLAVGIFIGGCAFFFYEISSGNRLLFSGLFPMLLYGLVFILVFRKKDQPEFAAGLIILLLFSMVTAVNFGEFNKKKEKGERELYANRLATEKNIETEAEYLTLETKIVEDNFLKKFISQPGLISVSDFQEGLERRLFNGYWERYEMSFRLFDETHSSLLDDRDDSESRYEEMQRIIDVSGIPSELDSNIYFISDYKNQYSYIIRQELEGKGGEKAILFCTLKSKKIPEEIGFPRLLISQEANVLESLEAYSIAKFHDKRLVNKYGVFSYPSSPSAMLPNVKNGTVNGFFDYGGFNHFALSKTPNDIIVLSIKNRTTIDLVTSFSYLFSFYGLMLFPLLLRFNTENRFRRTLTLAMKIQIVLIALVFLSLLSFGWGSGVFVSNQYSQYTDDVIREKLNSVQTEVKAKLGSFDQLSINTNGNYMQYILQKFAKVFFTDINLYDNNGYLLATSRPKVFNSGLLSEQMNPIAFKEMKFLEKSEFVHDESIGNLNYASAYLPFYNNNGVRMGFINLQHFGQQRELENQIQRFLVSIINVFILLLAISVVLAIFISNWLTSPLRILQESFASVKFGKQNEPISYDREDEIGALVKDYNQKLEELEFAANQLAKSERESAWREMAKQVAHEIKNPLTPMKLSVQQLLRTYDPDDPKSGEKLKKVSNSIIEQIDALTRIANEFSNFAKMPNPSEEEVDLVALIKGVIEVFTTDDGVSIELQSTKSKIAVLADKNQLLRVFNNLIKNAIQAQSETADCRINISLNLIGKEVHVEVKDNGVGIDPSEQSKIFVPYFTTKSTGTGLGLAMVKQIIENHKGTIDFESTPGVGTSFIITLPVVSTIN